ncbi:pancreatic secretory granule membrane major glycoprotein GP2-like isoform X1 [Anguilla rostrata]|uniref:pancreatic secretory granule membrane major glycoprotein GP2-like isoform X1 n=1 Tax=Anguilla rostrata TaxID=7938 RepID=UPI0030CD07AE
MFLVVPWTMPPSLEDPRAEARVLLEGIIKSKLQNLLSKFWPKAEVQLILFEDSERKTKTKITFESFDVSSQDGVVILRPEEQLQHIISLGHAHITVTDDSIYWDDADECDSPALNKCSSNSVCINTLDSFTCVCEPGYYSLSPILSPACHEKGMFTLCLKDHVSGGISKPFLIHYFGGNVTVVLNDGRCSINETDKFYYYRITGAPSQCGGQTLINRTHVELRNVLTVTLSSRRSITRRDLKVLWTCAYPLLQTSTARMKPGLDWVTSHSVVQVNSSRLLEISMALYSDSSYAYNYTGPVELPSAEQLYIQVTLHCEDSLAYNMSLQLESCWATQTADPQEEKKAFFLKGGCPNDRTFRWYLQSSSPQRKRFSVQMFTMSDHSHIYLHCLSRICSQDENCTTNCSPRQNQKVRRDLPDKLTATVSAGPISAAKRKLSNWPGAQIMLSVAGGLIGLFFLTALGVRAAHAITQRNPRHQ